MHEAAGALRPTVATWFILTGSQEPGVGGRTSRAKALNHLTVNGRASCLYSMDVEIYLTKFTSINCLGGTSMLSTPLENNSHTKD